MVDHTSQLPDSVTPLAGFAIELPPEPLDARETAPQRDIKRLLERLFGREGGPVQKRPGRGGDPKPLCVGHIASGEQARAMDYDGAIRRLQGTGRDDVHHVDVPFD
jgi:hypothetical protein